MIVDSSISNLERRLLALEQALPHGGTTITAVRARLDVDIAVTTNNPTMKTHKLGSRNRQILHQHNEERIPLVCPLEIVTEVWNNMFMAPPALQPPLLPCLDKSVNNRYPTIITFEATFANGSNSPLSPDAHRNNKNLHPKEIPNTSMIIQKT
jgi:hypothetical protein